MTCCTAPCVCSIIIAVFSAQAARVRCPPACSCRPRPWSIGSSIGFARCSRSAIHPLLQAWQTTVTVVEHACCRQSRERSARSSCTTCWKCGSWPSVSHTTLAQRGQTCSLVTGERPQKTHVRGTAVSVGIGPADISLAEAFTHIGRRYEPEPRYARCCGDASTAQSLCCDLDTTGLNGRLSHLRVRLPDVVIRAAKSQLSCGLAH